MSNRKGHRARGSIKKQATKTPEPPPIPPATEAPARYVLGTSVPTNWRPYVPVRVENSSRSVRLRRARLPNQPLQPVDAILGVESTFIAEEEVPRAGRLVESYYKRARWIGGGPICGWPVVPQWGVAKAQAGWRSIR